MMGRLYDRQQPLFYDFCLEDHVPQDHLLRQIAKVLDLSDVREKLAPYYSSKGRPSLDPELMIRRLLIGYLYGIRSERRLVEEVHLNLAYRWFCGLGLTGEVPERSGFPKTRHGRVRESDAFRMVFESVLQTCLRAGLIGGETFATDASVIEAHLKAPSQLPSSAIARHDRRARRMHLGGDRAESPQARQADRFLAAAHARRLRALTIKGGNEGD